MAGSRKSLRRPPPSRRVKPLALIVCEGEKTEFQYFERFRQAKRLSATALEVVPGDTSGSNPKSIVEYARKRSKEQRSEKLPFDRVWCVFDRDEHEWWDDALTQARDNGFEVAFSNPCFELWILLHYVYQSAQIERAAALSKVPEHLPDYSKSSDIYDTLLPSQTTAVQNAQKLRAYHARNCSPETHNPSTTVDRLVEYLNGLEASRPLAARPGGAASPDARGRGGGRSSSRRRASRKTPRTKR